MKLKILLNIKRPSNQGFQSSLRKNFGKTFDFKKYLCYNKYLNEIKRKAQKIVELEKAQRYTELEQFISTLTVEEMFEIDEYIMGKKLLTF